MWRALYTASLVLALPWILARLWWRGAREPGYREHVAERFGRFPHDAAAGVIWIHAVSVGEARAAEPLVRALQRAHPGERVLLTCLTAAGRQTIAERYGESVMTAYLPYDFPGACGRFLAHFQPRLGVLMETEIWPNLLAACRAAGVPVVLANARLSEESARGYARFAALSRPAFASLAAVCAQSELAAARLRALGAPGVQLCGNMKFDAEADAAKLAEGREMKSALGNRRVLLLASTREGEEAMLLDAFAASAAAPDVLLAIVPRHPQRFDEVANLAATRGFVVARRSEGGAIAREARVLVGDSMGEMLAYYEAADVVIMGGSLLPFGSQNLIEACALGKPVIVGPHTYNFGEASKSAIAAGAALRVADAEQALKAAAALAADPARREAMGRSALAFVAAHRGAVARLVDWIEATTAAR